MNAINSLFLQDNDKPYKDPLRELILMAEESVAKVDEQYATNLAKEASILNNVKEIRIDVNLTKAALKPVTILTAAPQLAQKEATNLSSVFQDKKGIVDPAKEHEFLMKLNAMEESDTEFVGNVERPILGKVSLMRRAKSAVSRSIIERRINDKHPLFNVAWQNQSSMANSNLVSKHECHTIDIDVHDEENNCSNDDIPTPEEVKRHMELFHLRRGHPPPSAKLEEPRKATNSKSRSARTTKSNRVAPSNDDLDEAPPVRKISSRIRSAKISTTTDKNEPDLSQDPLEPWSTKDLLDINKILES